MNQPKRKRPQLSLSFMLMLNVVFCGIGAAFYWASQVPAIRNEVSMIFGGRPGPSGDDDRRMHMIFLMFTYSAPLLLAGTLSLILAIGRRFERKEDRSEPTDPFQ